jgi:hypothetical protein
LAQTPHIRHHGPVFQLILPFQLDLPFEAGPAPVRTGGTKLSRLERGPRPKRVRRDRDRSSLSLDLSLQLPMLSAVERAAALGHSSERLEPGEL